MAQSSGPSLLTIILIAAGGYVLYEWLFASSTAAASSATPATPAPTTPPTPANLGTPVTTTSTATPTTAPASNSLDSMYQNMVNSATANNFTSGNPDQWCYYFSQGNSGKACPDPDTMGWDRNNAAQWPTTLTAAQFWSQASQYISTAYGVSGLGLLGGLGAYVRHQRGW